jgi:hypothetical protein
MSNMENRNYPFRMHKNIQFKNRISLGKPYLIKKGDTLWDISFKEYNESKYWPYIWLNNIYPVHLSQISILSPLLLYPNTTIYLPLKHEVHEWYDKEDKWLLDSIRMSYFHSQIRTYSYNNYLSEDNKIDNKKVAKGEDNKTLKDVFGKLSIDLKGLEHQTGELKIKKMGKIHYKLVFNFGKLSVQKESTAPSSIGYTHTIKTKDKNTNEIEIKKDISAFVNEFNSLPDVAKEFFSTITYKVSPDITNPSASVTFGSIKVEIDKTSKLPSIGYSNKLSTILDDKSAKLDSPFGPLDIKVDLKASIPIGPILVFSGAFEIDKVFGEELTKETSEKIIKKIYKEKYNGESVKIGLEEVSASLTVYYFPFNEIQKDKDKKPNRKKKNPFDHDLLNNSLKYMILIEYMNKLQKDYQHKTKPGEKLVNVPKQKKNKKKVKRPNPKYPQIKDEDVTFTAPVTKSETITLMGYYDETHVKNLNMLLARKNKFDLNAKKINSIKDFLNDHHTELHMTKFSHVLDKVPFSFWYVNVYPNHLLYKKSNEDMQNRIVLVKKENDLNVYLGRALVVAAIVGYIVIASNPVGFAAIGIATAVALAE